MNDPVEPANVEEPATDAIHNKAFSLLFFILFLTAIIYSATIKADTPVFELVIRNHLFYPSEITIPADTKVKLLIRNEDPTSEEFESYELNREKVISGSNKTIIFIGPLPPGEYPFFGEFYPKTAQGKIFVEQFKGDK